MSPDRLTTEEIGALDLADLIDASAFQKLMDDFYAVAGIPMSIIDVKGRVLVGVGWQDICTRFHRMQPDSAGNCLESDTRLSAGLGQGEYRLYKCKNNMWDMATPIIVAGQHVGNVFTGQFFFEDETIDRGLFRAQARKYGFDEKEYMSALDRVPRLGRKTVDRGTSFLLELADTLSQLGYTNFNLKRVLAERDHLTSSLRESQGILEAALASMTDAVFVSDAKGQFIHFNDAFATFHKYRNKEACTKSFAENLQVLDLFLANGDFANPEQRPVRRALQGETASNVEYGIERKDTGENWIGSYSFGPIRGKDGAIIGSVVVARDITERKRAEEELRQSREDLARAQEVGQIGSWRIDTRRNVLTWSDETYRIFGVPAGTQLTYETFLDRIHPDDRQYVETQWNAALSGEPYDIEHRITIGDRVKWVREKAYLEFDRARKLTGGFGICQDITVRKRAEEALRLLNTTLEQQVVERTELAESRAKQLQVLAMELLEAEERERQRVSELLHDDLQQILASARMQLGAACKSLPPEPILMNVEQLLEQSIAKSRRLSHDLSPAVLHHSGLGAALQWLVNEMKERFGLHVLLDAEGAQQFVGMPLKVFMFRAVQELLFNVVKHAGVKNARIAIASSNGNLDITVSDEGTGIDPEIINSPSPKRGIGLLTLRERARYIGGSLTIEGGPGQGSRCTLTIPISLHISEELKSPAVGVQPPARELPLSSVGVDRLRVLFADDHQILRNALIRLMDNQHGIQVVGQASNGREALEQVRQLKPDVVVMDVSMPEMDGIEATRRIKAELPDVRVIGLSMHEDEQIAQLLLRQSNRATKPHKPLSDA